LRTFFGPIDLPLSRILGLATVSSQEDHVIVALTDGQVLDGALMDPPARMHLASGGEVAVPLHQLLSLGFAISPDKPHRTQPRDEVLLLRSGERLYYDPAGVQGVFHTAHGPVKLETRYLRALHFQTPRGGLQQVVFRNGSVLSGLLEADQMRLKLDFGEEYDIPIHWLHRLTLTGEKPSHPGLAQIDLANGDVIFAQVRNETLKVQTASGSVEVRPEQLESVVAREGLGAGLQCKLRNGSVITGKAETMLLDLKIQPGPALKVYIGQVARLEMPEESGETPDADNRGAEESAPPRPDAPEVCPPEAEEAAAIEAAMRAALEAAARQRAKEKEAQAREEAAKRESRAAEAARRRNAAP
jgi:hypothetical protein